MTTGALAAIILTLIFTQIALAISIGVYRRRRRLREAGPESVQEIRGAIRDVHAPAAVPTTPPVDGAWEGYREFRVERRVYENADRSICSFYLAPVDAEPLPPFKPGQFLTFKLAAKEVNGRDAGQLIRCYSLSDGPGEDQYRISVKRALAPGDQPNAPPGVVSNYLHDRLHEGGRLMVKAPSGHFHLDEDSTLPVVLIGGGVGITPMMSMLNRLVVSGSAREVWLFYGARDGRELIMGEHLRSLSRAHDNFHLNLCFSRPSEREVEGVDFHHRGRVDIQLLRDSLKLGRYQFYICGPKGMMENLVTGLESLGVEGADVHYESFGPSTPTRPRQSELEGRDVRSQTSIITFSKSGKQTAWDPGAGSILALAEAQGIEVESGCRAGCCGSCETLIERGEVEYSQDPEADVEPGHCLLCISSPKGDVALAI